MLAPHPCAAIGGEHRGLRGFRATLRLADVLRHSLDHDGRHVG